MELIIAILMCLRVCATPDQLNDANFKDVNRDALEKTQMIIDHQSYQIKEGGVVIIDEVSS
jgi:hypothetical protein